MPARREDCFGLRKRTLAGPHGNNAVAPKADGTVESGLHAASTSIRALIQVHRASTSTPLKFERHEAGKQRRRVKLTDDRLYVGQGSRKRLNGYDVAVAHRC